MSTKPYYTSDTLVEAVRRRCSLPKSNSLISDQDILDFANDELMETVFPMIKGLHEEYFLWNNLQELEANTSNYVIPERALGNTLRDLAFKDDQGNEYEMTRILRDDRYTTQFPGIYLQPYRYYVENSSVVLVPPVNATPSGSLKMTYLVRPNLLVDSSRVAKVVSTAAGTVLIDSITVGATTTINCNTAHHLEDGEQITISSVSGTGASLLNTTHNVTVVNSITFTVDVDTTGQGPFTGGQIDNNTTVITTDSLASNFTVSETIDILQTKSPHIFLNIDVTILELSNSLKTLTIKDSDVPALMVVGDTIALSNETDIPGVPTEIHRLLLSKTCERVLEAVGDKDGFAIAASKSAQSSNSAESLLSNRVESAPIKVKNKSGFLTRKFRRTRRF